ncbi:MAG: hypothetical protein K8H84_07795 [Sulfuricella denitrificans]|nr:hypothetical protein [Sulfuricella denitrificans]
MKKLLAALSAITIASISAFAFADDTNGIYSCSVTTSGQTSSSFMTLNGQHVDGGVVVATFPAMSSSSAFYGYVLFTRNGDIFTGTTNYNQTAYAIKNGSRLSGNVTIMNNGVPVAATFNCTMFF